MAIAPSSFSPPPDADRLKQALKGVKFRARPSDATVSASRPHDLDQVRFVLALRGWVRPQEVLPAHLDDRTRVAFLDALAADCETSTAGGGPRWTLKDSVRRCTLRTRTPADVAAALDGMAPEERDSVAQALRVLYIGPLPDLASLTSEQLRTLATAAEWSEGHAPNTVDIIEARRHAARAARDEHYRRTVAGGFFGRRDEMEQLSEFLTAPMDVNGGGLRVAWVWGPGGVGKSTLIAATALDILRDSPQAAVAHLDFDRSELDPTRSASLNLEVLRQVGGADPAIERALASLRERIREQLGDDLAHGFHTARQTSVPEAAASDSQSILVGALDWLRVTQQPLLLILDTCEQIQAGGPDYWDALQRWLHDFSFSSGAPEVRALLCGRTDPAQWSISAPVVFTHRLTDLSLDDSVALLVHRGVPGSVATAAAVSFGGNPLMLQLFANLSVTAGKKDVEEIASAARGGDFPPELVQGLLYDRFLKHIDDPDARRYAHPGLILPEVTRELIQHVVAPVLGDRDITAARADAIFIGLAAATWLTEYSGGSTILTQRPDVRRLMLRLMRSDVAKQEQAAQLRTEAIAYHRKRGTEADRAFALYHRLMAVTDAEDLARFDDEDVAGAMRHLRRYADDFPAVVQSYVQARSLTDLGPDEALKSLPDAAWATYLTGEGTQPGYGERAVRAGDPMIPLNLWRRRPLGNPSNPPTFVLQAQHETGEWDGQIDFEQALEAIATTQVDVGSVRRLHVLTSLALVQTPGPLAPHHEEILRRLVGPAARVSGYVELYAIAAVAEAFAGVPVVPEPLLRNDALASETRLYLVRLQTSEAQFDWRPHLDALITIQQDWHTRAGHALDAHAADSARDVLMSLHGAPLDFVTSALQKLRQPVRLAAGPGLGDAATRVALLRGGTPEFYRPVRQALREAFATAGQIETLMTRFRPRLTICPRDLEPDLFAPRAARDPVNLFLSLAQFADRARVLGSLLDLAHDLAPTAKIARVRRAWHAWDAALCGGRSSDW